MSIGSTRLDDGALPVLAVLGGEPSFPEPLHVGRPNIGNRRRLMQRIEGILDRRWLTNGGPLVQEFEEAIQAKLGVEHCVATCNGSIALEIAIRALGMSGEVIVPSFSFIATAHCLQWQEIRPVFCDIDPKTHNIDPRQVERLITRRTTGILGVHLWGFPCDTDALAAIAMRHNLRLLYDASHAFGCKRGGEYIGTFGDAEVFSFHATKALNSFEGGAIVTKDGELARRIRYMKNFGFAGYDRVVHLGTNGKMTEIAAAMGLTSLESMEEFFEVNRRNHSLYCSLLDGIPGISIIRHDRAENWNHHYVVLEIDGTSGLTRDELLQVLHREGVKARRYFWPGCHRMEPYLTHYPKDGVRLPETEWIAERVLCLPTGTAVETRDVQEVCRIIRVALAMPEKVKAALFDRRQL